MSEVQTVPETAIPADQDAPSATPSAAPSSASSPTPSAAPSATPDVPPIAPNPDATEPSPEIRQRGELLFAQARAIRAAGGPDVMTLFDADEEIRQNVLSGRWDFADVARMRPSARAYVPPTPRAANGDALRQTEIGAMSEAQFSRLNDTLARGGSVRLGE